MIRIYPRCRLLACFQGQGFHLPLGLEIDFTQGALGFVLTSARRLTLNNLAGDLIPTVALAAAACAVPCLPVVRYTSVMSSTASDKR